MSFPLYRFQSWRDRHTLHGATGRSRSGYTEIKDERSSLVTDIKRSGKLLDKEKNKLQMIFSATDDVLECLFSFCLSET